MGLKRIALRDFVIVQALDLDLHGGFTALTGETGAGKSILIDAVQLALGARADAGVVREGAPQADICAEFECPARLKPWLEQGGFALEDSLLLRRVIDAQGRSRAWINGAPATATQLRTVGEQLLDIHGQHAWQSLTRPDAARELLDAYAGLQTQPLRNLWTVWRNARQALEHAIAAQDTLQRERERLQWQISEVEKLDPGEDEWEELNAQHTRLSHAQALLDTAQGALFAIEDDETGGLAALGRAHSDLQDQEHLDPEFKEIAEVLASGLAQVSDARHSLQ
ncbi:MAG: AAA family ATPase, partial [Comamonas sp.]